MTRTTWVALVALVAAATAGCEKAGGKPPEAKAELLADLPGGNAVLIGLNLAPLKDFEASAFGQIMKVMTASMPSVASWQNCFLEDRSLTIVGGLRKVGDEMQTAYVMKGMDIADVATCAKRAGFSVSVDPDGKFVGIDLADPKGAVKTGYLRLADGALLTDQAAFAMGNQPQAPTDRGKLEADVAALHTTSAAGDTALVHAMAEIDTAKSVWMVGSGAGTSIADKLGAFHAAIDLTTGLTIDATATITDAGFSAQITEGVSMLKAKAAQLGPEFGAVADKLVFDHHGDELHIAIAIDNAQMTAITQKLAPMMGRK